MRLILPVVFCLLGFSSQAQENQQSIFNPGDKKPDVQMSTCVECERQLAKLKVKLICYKCCTGELDKEQCKDLGNFDYCKKKKKCGC